MSISAIPDWKFDRPIWSVDKRRGLYIPTISHARVRNEWNEVVLYFDGYRVPLRTPEAHKMGFALWRAADHCIMDANDGVLWNGDFAQDFVVLKLNGQEIFMEAGPARQLGSSLLRRADFVDQFQTGRTIQ